MSCVTLFLGGASRSRSASVPVSPSGFRCTVRLTCKNEDRQIERKDMTTQPNPLFTVTIESRRPDTLQWDITAQATDTLAGLVEWASPANPTFEPPSLPLTTETVRGFIGSTFEQDNIRNRVQLVQAAPGEKSTLDTLEDFARRRENGTATAQELEQSARISDLYFRPPNGFFFA